MYEICWSCKTWTILEQKYVNNAFEIRFLVKIDLLIIANFFTLEYEIVNVIDITKLFWK